MHPVGTVLFSSLFNAVKSSRSRYTLLASRINFQFGRWYVRFTAYALIRSYARAQYLICFWAGLQGRQQQERVIREFGENLSLDILMINEQLSLILISIFNAIELIPWLLHCGALDAIDCRCCAGYLLFFCSDGWLFPVDRKARDFHLLHCFELHTIFISSRANMCMSMLWLVKGGCARSADLRVVCLRPSYSSSVVSAAIFSYRFYWQEIKCGALGLLENARLFQWNNRIANNS